MQAERRPWILSPQERLPRSRWLKANFFFFFCLNWKTYVLISSLSSSFPFYLLIHCIPGGDKLFKRSVSLISCVL